MASEDECRCAATVTDLLAPKEVVAAAEKLATLPDAPEFGELAILVFGWTAVALYVCWHCSKMRGCRAQLKKFAPMGRVMFWVAGRRSRADTDAKATEEERFEAAVDRALDARLEKNMLLVLRFATGMHAFYQWGASFQMLSKNPRWNSFGQSSCFLSFFIIYLVTVPFHARIVKGRSALVYGFLMAELTVNLYVSRRTPIAFLITESGKLLTRAALSAIYPKAVPVLFWNFLYSIVGARAALETFNRTEFACMVILYQAQNTIAILCLCVVAAKVAEATVRKDLEASVLRGESSGLCNLLDLVCDVVVSLDDSLKITDSARRFAAMVTLQGKSVEGSRLQDFMPAAEDQQAFEKYALSHTADVSDAGPSPPPRAMHVKLRDSLGNLIRAELFCVAFQSPVRRSFFVGIKEVTDSLPIPECQAFRSTSRRRGRTRSRARGTTAAPARADIGDRDGASSSTSSRSASSGSGSDRSVPPGSGRRRRLRIPGGGLGPGGDVWNLPVQDGGRDISALVPTSDVGVEMALVRLMRLCVVNAEGRVDPDGTTSTMSTAATECCPFHQRVQRLRDRLHKFRGMTCAPQFHPRFEAQCHNCGLLVGASADGERLRCFACEVAVEMRADAERPIETL